jgi:hypothetical protein
VLEALAGECPLCGERHLPKFYAFVLRSYRDPEQGCTVWIPVPRIICPPNKERRQAGDPSLQYTLRVLPGFLIPYSRVVVDAVQGALRGYLGQRELNEDGAAFRMGCLNPSSFRLFYRRVRRRIGAWISFIGELLLSLGGTISSQQPPAASPGLGAQWAWYTRLALEWLRVHDRQPGSSVILRPLWWQYVYAALARRQMGLGP